MRTRSLSPSIRRSKAVSGFTLIELLVAVGITAMLVTLMLTIVINVMSSWSRSSGTLETNAQARVVLDQLAVDLQSAIMRRDTNAWLMATVQPTQSNANDSGMAGAYWDGAKRTGTESVRLDPDGDPSTTDEPLSDYRFGPAGVWLRFFTITPGSNVTGDYSAPRAVSYQIVRRQVGTDYVYQFFRSQVWTDGTSSTFSVGYDLSSATAAYNTALDKGDDSTAALYEAPGRIRTPSTTYLLANNVVDFGVRFWNGSTLKFPTSDTTLGFAATAKTSVASADGVPITVIDFPTSAEVMIRLLTPEGARLIQALETNAVTEFEGKTGAEAWWEIATRHSKVYTRRIEMKATAL